MSAVTSQVWDTVRQGLRHGWTASEASHVDPDEALQYMSETDEGALVALCHALSDATERDQRLIHQLIACGESMPASDLAQLADVMQGLFVAYVRRSIATRIERERQA